MCGLGLWDTLLHGDFPVSPSTQRSSGMRSKRTRLFPGIRTPSVLPRPLSMDSVFPQSPAELALGTNDQVQVVAAPASNVDGGHSFVAVVRASRLHQWTRKRIGRSAGGDLRRSGRSSGSRACAAILWKLSSRPSARSVAPEQVAIRPGLDGQLSGIPAAGWTP